MAVIKGRQLIVYLKSGIQGQKGEQGDSGIVNAISPLNYNPETKIISIENGYVIPLASDIDKWNNYENQIGDIASVLDEINGEFI